MVPDPGAPRSGGWRYGASLAGAAGLLSAYVLAAGSGLTEVKSSPFSWATALEAPIAWADLDCDGEQDPALLILDRNGPALAEAGEIRSRLPRSWAEDEDDTVSRSDRGADHVRRYSRHFWASRARGPRRGRDVVPRGGSAGDAAVPVSLPESEGSARALVSTTREPGDPRGPPARRPLGGSPLRGNRALGAFR